MTNLYETFKDEIWQPEDYTNRFWYERTWGIGWSEEGETQLHPEDWSDSYDSDRVRDKTVRGDYMLVTLDDGCGGRYQAFFSLKKKVDDE